MLMIFGQFLLSMSRAINSGDDTALDLSMSYMMDAYWHGGRNGW